MPFLQFIAGVFLSYGGLLSEVIQGGSPGINASDPGLLKVLGGFVFPVGLVMYGHCIHVELQCH